MDEKVVDKVDEISNISSDNITSDFKHFKELSEQKSTKPTCKKSAPEAESSGEEDFFAPLKRRHVFSNRHYKSSSYSEYAHKKKTKKKTKPHQSWVKCAEQTMQKPLLLPKRTFFFRQRSGKLDTREIANLDLHQIIENTDIDAIQSHLENLAFADVTLQDVQQYSDEYFLKLFQIAQLTVEYLLNVQESLVMHSEELEIQCTDVKSKCVKMKNEIKQNNSEIELLKREIEHKQNTVATFEMMLLNYSVIPPGEKNVATNALTSIAKDMQVKQPVDCPFCKKRFVSVEYLVRHQHRKHVRDFSLSQMKKLRSEEEVYESKFNAEVDIHEASRNNTKEEEITKEIIAPVKKNRDEVSFRVLHEKTGRVFDFLKSSNTTIDRLLCDVAEVEHVDVNQVQLVFENKIYSLLNPSTKDTLGDSIESINIRDNCSINLFIIPRQEQNEERESKLSIIEQEVMKAVERMNSVMKETNDLKNTISVDKQVRDEQQQQTKKENFDFIQDFAHQFKQFQETLIDKVKCETEQAIGKFKEEAMKSSRGKKTCVGEFESDDDSIDNTRKTKYDASPKILVELMNRIDDEKKAREELEKEQRKWKKKEKKLLNDMQERLKNYVVEKPHGELLGITVDEADKYGFDYGISKDEEATSDVVTNIPEIMENIDVQPLAKNMESVIIPLKNEIQCVEETMVIEETIEDYEEKKCEHEVIDAIEAKQSAVELVAMEHAEIEELRTSEISSPDSKNEKPIEVSSKQVESPAAESKQTQMANAIMKIQAIGSGYIIRKRLNEVNSWILHIDKEEGVHESVSVEVIKGMTAAQLRSILAQHLNIDLHSVIIHNINSGKELKGNESVFLRRDGLEVEIIPTGDDSLLQKLVDDHEVHLAKGKNKPGTFDQNDMKKMGIEDVQRIVRIQSRIRGMIGRRKFQEHQIDATIDSRINHLMQDEKNSELEVVPKFAVNGKEYIKASYDHGETIIAQRAENLQKKLIKRLENFSGKKKKNMPTGMSDFEYQENMTALEKTQGNLDERVKDKMKNLSAKLEEIMRKNYDPVKAAKQESENNAATNIQKQWKGNKVRKNINPKEAVQNDTIVENANDNNATMKHVLGEDKKNESVKADSIESKKDERVKPISIESKQDKSVRPVVMESKKDDSLSILDDSSEGMKLNTNKKPMKEDVQADAITETSGPLLKPLDKSGAEEVNMIRVSPHKSKTKKLRNVFKVFRKKKKLLTDPDPNIEHSSNKKTIKPDTNLSSSDSEVEKKKETNVSTVKKETTRKINTKKNLEQVMSSSSDSDTPKAFSLSSDAKGLDSSSEKGKKSKQAKAIVSSLSDSEIDKDEIIKLADQYERDMETNLESQEKYKLDLDIESTKTEKSTTPRPSLSNIQKQRGEKFSDQSRFNSR